MTDKKLSQLPAGTAIQSTDLFYSAQDIGGGNYTQVKQPASALSTFIGSISGGTPGTPQYAIQFNNPLGTFAGNAGFLLDANSVFQINNFASNTLNGVVIALNNANAIQYDGAHMGVDIDVTSDTRTSGLFPGFSGDTLMQNLFTCWNGDLSYGGGTNSKTTYNIQQLDAVCFAGCQGFVTTNSMTGLGMGDKFIDSNFLEHDGGPIAGDEGIGFTAINHLYESDSLFQTTITSVPTPSSANTTTTQVITGAASPQAVTVASTVGIAVNDWVVVEQQIPSATPNIEAVKITAVNPGVSITGAFRNNHANGVSITPALLLLISTTNGIGQFRVIVNLSGASYSTGTVSSISGGGFTGSGTAWTNSIVGGSAVNVGAIALTADDFTSAPFGAGASALKAWYQILTVPSNTSIGIFSNSVAGDAGYHGYGPGAGGYIIRPAARILMIDSSSGPLLICERSTHTWTAGNTIECVHCPYPDVHGWQTEVTEYVSGGIRRAFNLAANTGARMYQEGFALEADRMITGSNSDFPIGWNTGFSVGGCNTGLSATAAQYGAYLSPITGLGKTNPTGLRIDDWSGAGVGNNWNVWSRGANSINTFEGLLSVGLTGGANTGKVNLIGKTGGIVTLSTQDVAGTWTLKLPTTAGTNTWFLQTDGSGNTTWAAGGGGGGTPSTPNNSVQYDNAGAFGGAANFFISSGNPNVTAGNLYLYGGLNALFSVANVFGDNWFVGEAGNLTVSGQDNTAFGQSALGAVTSGIENVAVGNLALSGCTTGARNTAVGRGALGSAVNSDHGTAIGDGAMGSATGGSNNVAIGSGTLVSNTSGSVNVAVGTSALNHNTSGSSNVALGQGALGNSTTGGNNVAIGANSMAANMTGSNNVGLGQNSLNSATTASNNFGMGNNALQFQIDGTDNVALGAGALQFSQHDSQNIAIGSASGNSLNGGSANILIGNQTGISITTGSNNVCIGGSSGTNAITGGSNVIVGDAAGQNVTAGANTILGGSASRNNISTGQQNICIGFNTAVPSATTSGQLSIGNYIYGTGLTGQTTTISTGKIGIGIKAPNFNLDVAGSLGQAEAAFLIHTSVALTGGATGNVPTLTAGPVTGNPTKWLPIDDNGTTRFIPAW